MKTVYDTLLAMPATRDPMIEHARAVLVLPGENHGPMDALGYARLGKCDRIVISEQVWHALCESILSLDAVTRADICTVPTPFATFS